MIETVLNACFAEISVDTVKVLFSALSLSLAVAAVLALRRFSFSTKGKVALMYSHLAGLFFPFVLFSTNAACGFFCMPCFENPTALALLALPTTLLLSAAAGFVIIPGYYLLSRKSLLVKNKSLNSFLRSQARSLKLRSPSLYILDQAKPLAFSFRSFASAIFLSVGLLDILRRKEVEAVLLHELFHLKATSSVLKLSSHLMKFSPFSFLKGFGPDLGREEELADSFVREVQQTSRHLEAAKRKMREFSAWAG